MNKYVRYFLLIFSLTSILGFTLKNTESSTQKLQKTLGKELTTIISNNKNVVMMTVEHNRKPPFPPTSSEKSLSLDDAAALKQLLLNDKHYKFGLKKRSLFIPIAALVIKDSKPITIYIGQSSQELLVEVNNQPIYLNYDPMADELNTFINHILERR